MAFTRRAQTPKVALGPPVDRRDSVFAAPPVGGISIEVGPLTFVFGSPGGGHLPGDEIGTVFDGDLSAEDSRIVPLIPGGPSLRGRIAAADAAAEAAICPCP